METKKKKTVRFLRLVPADFKVLSDLSYQEFLVLLYMSAYCGKDPKTGNKNPYLLGAKGICSAFEISKKRARTIFSELSKKQYITKQYVLIKDGKLTRTTNEKQAYHIVTQGGYQRRMEIFTTMKKNVFKT